MLSANSSGVERALGEWRDSGSQHALQRRFGALLCRCESAMNEPWMGAVAALASTGVRLNSRKTLVGSNLQSGDRTFGLGGKQVSGYAVYPRLHCLDFLSVSPWLRSSRLRAFHVRNRGLVIGLIRPIRYGVEDFFPR